MMHSAAQQVKQLVKKIKGHREVLDSAAKRLRTPQILDTFDRWNHDSWCFATAGDALVRLRIFTEQNFNFIETMSTIAVARYIFELSVWLHLFKLDRRYGLVYYSQLLDTQLKYWEDNRAQLYREIAMLEDFERKERDAQSETLDQIKAISDPEMQKNILLTANKTVPNIIDKQAGHRFSIYVEQAKVNGSGFQAHLLREKLIPQIDQSIIDITSEKTAFNTRIPQGINDLIPDKWQWKRMAQKVGLTDEYNYIYAFSSKLLHATPASITTDQKNLELREIVVFLKYIDVKILDMLELANEYLWGTA
jgi:hypothetical protein